VTLSAMAQVDTSALKSSSCIGVATGLSAATSCRGELGLKCLILRGRQIATSTTVLVDRRHWPSQEASFRQADGSDAIPVRLGVRRLVTPLLHRCCTVATPGLA
jgi:hypothetical protein